MKGELAIPRLKIAIHNSYAKAARTPLLRLFVDVRNHQVIAAVSVKVGDQEARQGICAASKTRIAKVVGNKLR